MNSIGSFIGIVLFVGWLGMCIWSWMKPVPTTNADSCDAERDRQIGLIIGMLGGTVEAAAQVRYAISRLEEDLGRKVTLQEIAVATGVKLGLGD